MNGFEKFEIDHLSPSNINLWINAPDVWVIRYLLNKRTPFGPAAKRGTVVEQAVADMLAGTNADTAMTRAYEAFDKHYLIGDEKTGKERAVIEPMAAQAYDALKQYGKPEFTEDGQHKISITATGEWGSIPVIGFLDFVFPEHGLVVDLKTTARIPSQMSLPHQIQRAVYAKARGNQTVKFLYASAKKTVLLEDGDVNTILALVKAHIARLEAFLSLCPDAETATAIVPVNHSSFYWSGAQSLAQEIYGVSTP